MIRKPMNWFGVLLISAGVLLLLRGTGVLPFRWTIVFWIALGVGGAVWVTRGFRRSAPAAVFWGMMLFLGAAFEVLRAVPFLDLSSYYLFPAIILALGLSFLSAYVCRPKNFPLLVLALVFCSLAAGVWLVELGYLYRWEVVSTVRDYWPVALVLFGASLLIPRRTS